MERLTPSSISGLFASQVIRACLFGLLLVLAPLASAQTDATNSGPVVTPPPDAPPTTATNAPLSAAPDATPSAPPAIQPQLTPLTSPSPAQGSADQQEEITDIRPPVFFLHSWFWLWITLAAIAVVALLVWLWNLLKPNRLLSAKSAYDLTLEKLEKARSLLKEEDPMPYAVFVSEAIRSYLGQRFQSPSSRLTTEEFLRLMESDPNTPLAAHRELLRNFLQACDLVKFAKYQPTLAELEEVQQRAVTFVTATKPLPVQGRPS